MPTPWQPPIPKGAFVEARSLGAGLVLLGYCYDAVNSDGTLVLNLHELCPVLGASYATVRRWWADMQILGIIAESNERGRGGIRARFNPEWIDQRQVESSTEMRSESSSSVSAFPETSSSVSAKTKEMRSEMRSSMSLNGSACKVLHDDQNPERESDQHDRPDASLSLEKKRNGTEPIHPAVALYRTAWPDIRLTSKQEAIIRDVVGDRAEHLECWREVVRDYELSPNWKPENIGNMRKRFDRLVQERRDQGNGTGGGNSGRPPADNRPPLQLYQPQPLPKTDPAKFRAAIEEVARKKTNGNTS